MAEAGLVAFHSHPSTPSLAESDGPPHSTALDEFRTQLASCRRYSAIDQRSFYLDSRLLEWFRATPANDPESRSTNAGRLLLVVSDSVERSNPNFVNTLLEHMGDNDNRCWLRVFAILLQLDLEKLDPRVSAAGMRLNKVKMLNRFFNAHLCDRKLPMGVADLSKEIGTFGLGPVEVEEFAERFAALQWEFCTRDAFDDAYNHKYGFDTMILPICTMAKVKPGGSGKIFQIEVPVECIPKTLAAKITVKPYQKDDQSGEYQQFALKVLEDAEDYDQETFAYNALRRAEGMIVQCLGCWEYTLSSVQKEYHLLLEWGSYDLDDYFGFRAPPAVADEIVQFWKSLAGLIIALAKIHMLEVLNDGSHKMRYYGWHGDLKPENLLYCEESQKKGWKIGDPGFARFVKREGVELDNSKLPVIGIRGGTLTYGGPERAQDENIKVSQRFDIWSLGCVLSEVATWVVLGIRGVQQFRHVRRQTACNTAGEIILDEEDEFEKHGKDRFHNGNDTSDAVIEWHKYLKQAIRKSDPITAAILDLVEKQMLVKEPVKRITATDLVRHMKRIMDSAEALTAKNVYSTPKAFRIPFRLEQSKESAFLQESWEISNSSPTALNTIRSVKYKSKRFIDATKGHMGGSSTTIDNLMLPMSQPDDLADQDELFLRKAQTLPRNSRYSSLSAIEAGSELRKVQSPVDTDTGMKLTYWVARSVLEEMGWVSKALELPSEEGRAAVEPIQSPTRTGDSLAFRSSQTALSQPTTPLLKSPKMKGMSLLRKFSSKRMSWGPAQENQPSGSTTPLRPVLATIQSASPSTADPLRSPQTIIEERSRYKDFDIYFHNRDVIFLIDNGSSMPKHWPYAKDLMSVLTSFLYLQDDNGMDLFFTSTKDRFGPFTEPKDFINAMNQMKPTSPASASTSTEQVVSLETPAASLKLGRDENPANDIRKTLRHILGLWREEFQRKLTLIILTDGVWRGVSEKRSVATQIVAFLESWQDEEGLKQMLQERELSIQFIQFGDDPKAKEEFEYMDNQLKSSGGVRLPDIIDHEPAHDGDIRKMAIGSISVEWDNDNTTVTDEHENVATAGISTPVASRYHANSVDSFYTPAYMVRPTPKTIAQDTTLSGAAFADVTTSSPKVQSAQTWTRDYSDRGNHD